jgi:hypothetical protein
MAERLLILETSGRVGHVALAEGETLRGVRRPTNPERREVCLADLVLRGFPGRILPEHC